MRLPSAAFELNCNSALLVKKFFRFSGFQEKTESISF
uniref:Uncharacterized protein n=1 Tax=Anguilla anguilla TaxID=7936 RepID=A0A0E9SZ07_ANGAN